VQLLDIIEAERNLKVAATSMPVCRLSAACLPKPWRRQKALAQAESLGGGEGRFSDQTAQHIRLASRHKRYLSE